MKLWWVNFVKDYLTFTKKERRGIFISIILIPIIYFAASNIPVNKAVPDVQAFQKELAQLRVLVDTGHISYRYNNGESENSYSTHRGRYLNRQRELFPFDPNTLDSAGWKKLGVSERTIRTIQNFIGKGFRFRQASDIRKIYGLRTDEASRLVPYVHIADKTGPNKNSFENQFTDFSRKNDSDKFKPRIIDINEADTSEFISLPGIGSRLAARIVNFRQKLGGFLSVDQLGETYGIADSTFQKIKGRLQCLNPAVSKININTADAVELKKHPYFSWNIANAIVNYRTQHGSYASVNDLHKIEIITDDLFNKIAPYLTV